MNHEEPHSTDTHAAPQGAAEGGDARRRTSGDGPMGRLANESRALFDDLREWVDLRVQLVQVEVEERVERAANEVISLMIVAVMALFAFSFLLHGVAVWIGTALGGTHWGYLIVAAFLTLLTFVLRTARPNHIKRVASLYRADREEGAEDKRPPAAALPPPTKSKPEDPGSVTSAGSGSDNGPADQISGDAGTSENDDISEGNEQGGKDRG